MKKIVFFFSIIASLSSIVSAQIDYEWIFPKPHGETHRVISILDENTIRIISDGPHIIRSSDGGQTWNIKQNIENFNGGSISFGDYYTGWSALDGILSKTTDGGNTWFVQQPNFTYGRLYALNTNTVWQYGSDGAVYKTTDGGETWNSKSTGEPENLLIGQFLNDDIGYIGAVGGYIFKTTNSGDSWTYKNLGTSASISAIYFIDENTGFASIVSSPNIYKTTNGGQSWGQINSPLTGPFNYIDNIYFIDEQRGFVSQSYSNDRKRFFRTIDGGINWIEVPLKNANSLRFNFFNSNIGFAFGIWGDILKTTNSGETWDYLVEGMGADFSPSEISFINDDLGWIIGGPKIFKTVNGGTNWNKIYNPFSGVHYQDIFFLNEQVGWIGGSSNVLLKSTNSGEDWNVVRDSIYFGTGLRKVHFFDENNGSFILSAGNYSHGGITSNGGISIDTVYNRTGVRINDFFFLNQDKGWAVGDSVWLLTNGGANWTGLYDVPSESPTPTKIKFFNDSTGYFVTKGGGQYIRLFKTTNGGFSWNYKSLRPDSIFNVLDISYLNENTFVILGQNSNYYQVFLSTDAGEAYSKIFESRAFVNANMIYALTEQSGFIVTDKGLIRYSDGITSVAFDYTRNEFSPSEFHLNQNYPNPFNPYTTIKFSLPENSLVTLKVYNIVGEEVATLINGERDAGWYEQSFDASSLSSGIYIYRLSAGLKVFSKKMMLIK